MKKILNFFRKDPSASVAMERLQIIVSHKKNSSSNNNYLPQLKKDLIDVITKYVAIDENSVNVNLEQSATNDILEINIGLNDGNNRRILDA